MPRYLFYHRAISNFINCIIYAGAEINIKINKSLWHKAGFNNIKESGSGS